MNNDFKQKIINKPYSIITLYTKEDDADIKVDFIFQITPNLVKGYKVHFIGIFIYNVRKILNEKLHKINTYSNVDFDFWNTARLNSYMNYNIYNESDLKLSNIFSGKVTECFDYINGTAGRCVLFLNELFNNEDHLKIIYSDDDNLDTDLIEMVMTIINNKIENKIKENAGNYIQ